MGGNNPPSVQPGPHAAQEGNSMGFEFGNSAAEIEICGKAYMIEPYSKATLEAMAAYREGVKKAGESGDMPSFESVREVNALCGRMFDAVLGDGTYAELFKGREDDFIAHQELASYITGTLTAYITRRLAEKGVEAAREVLSAEKPVPDAIGNNVQ